MFILASIRILNPTCLVTKPTMNRYDAAVSTFFVFWRSRDQTSAYKLLLLAEMLCGFLQFHQTCVNTTVNWASATFFRVLYFVIVPFPIKRWEFFHQTDIFRRTLLHGDGWLLLYSYCSLISSHANSEGNDGRITVMSGFSQNLKVGYRLGYLDVGVSIMLKCNLMQCAGAGEVRAGFYRTRYRFFRLHENVSWPVMQLSAFTALLREVNIWSLMPYGKVPVRDVT
jgi:hypothetical protein